LQTAANMVRPDRQTGVFLHEPNIGFLRPTPEFAAELEQRNRHPALKLHVMPIGHVEEPPPGHALVNVLLRPINHKDIMWCAKAPPFSSLLVAGCGAPLAAAAHCLSVSEPPSRCSLRNKWPSFQPPRKVLPVPGFEGATRIT
jgi:hypothetical protein